MPDQSVEPKERLSSIRRVTYHRPADLSPRSRDEMWLLFSQAASLPRAAFEGSLARMDEVWLLEADGSVRGFGGVRFLFPEWHGRRCCVIVTGRVFLDPSVRGTNVLQRVGFHYYREQARLNPLYRVYWMFVAATYKSYLLLPRNFLVYWPRPQARIPERESAIIRSVATALEIPRYDPETGITRYPNELFVEGNLAFDPGASRDPDVAFYASINPGQSEGDGVLALCPLGPVNWAACLARALGRVTRRTLGGRLIPVGRTPDVKASYEAIGG